MDTPKLQDSARRAMAMLEPKEMSYSDRYEFERLKAADVTQGKRIAELMETLATEAASSEQYARERDALRKDRNDWKAEAKRIGDNYARSIRETDNVTRERDSAREELAEAKVEIARLMDYILQQLEPQTRTAESTPCECNEWPHAPYCPAR